LVLVYPSTMRQGGSIRFMFEGGSQTRPYIS
jgi:hypothetical protein